MEGRELRAFRIAYALWLFGLFAYFVPAATWNPVSRFDLTRSIVERGALDIDDLVADTGDRAHSGEHWYTDKAPIPSFLAVPVYAAHHVFEKLRGDAPRFSSTATGDMPAQHVSVNGAFAQGLYVCSISTAGLAGALLGVLIFEILRQRVAPSTALVASAATIIGTPIFPYATSFYGHTVAAVFLFGALAAVAIPASDELGMKGFVLAKSRVRMAGACMMLAAGSEYVTAGPAGAIALWLVWRAPPAARLAAVRDLALGALLPALAIGTYHTACFGAPWRTGYSYLPNAQFAAGHAAGFLGVHPPRLDALVGLLVGPRRGLFYIAPATLVAASAGTVYVARTREPIFTAAAIAVTVLLALNAGYYMWWGGAATGPRHLVPALGFLGLGFAAAWQRRWARWLLVPLLVVSIANMLVLTAVGLEAPEKRDVLFDYAWPRLLMGKIAHLAGASNLGIKLGLPRAATLGLPDNPTPRPLRSTGVSHETGVRSAASLDAPSHPRRGARHLGAHATPPMGSSAQ
jgi:hypothetical protein